MKMKTFLYTLTACVLFQAGAMAQLLTEYRNQVQVSTGGGSSGNLNFAFDGGLNDLSAAVSLDRDGRALSEASASYTFGGFVPTLRTRATASPARAQAVAWGVQGYSNNSGSALNTSLLLNLTANITGGNDIDASVYLFQDENFEFGANSGTILFETSSQLWPGFESFANNLGPTGFDIDIRNFTGVVNEQRSFDFTVDPGDSFYVWAMMTVTADNPGVADAFTTLTASLSDTTGLTVAAVPEPGTIALLLLGAMGLFWVRRKQ